MKLITIQIILLIFQFKTTYSNESINATQQIIKSLFQTSRVINKNIILDINVDKQLNTGQDILMECPLPQSLHSQQHKKQNRDTRFNKKSTPIFITTWYKNQLKINQFIGEYLDRVKFFERKLRIKELMKADSGVYSCEIITGNGQNVKSANLTLQVNDITDDFKEEEYETQETTNVLNDGDQLQMLNSYIKGEKPMFDDDNPQTIFYLLEATKVQFDCSTRGIPSPQLIWLKNGQIMSEEEYGLIRNVMILTLKGLSLADSGTYVCQVSNQFGKLNRTFSLNVLERLKLSSSQSQNVTSKLNETAVLKCELEPIYQGLEANFKWFIRAERSAETNNTSKAIQINGRTYFQLDAPKEDAIEFRNGNKLSFFLSKNLHSIQKMIQREDGSLVIRQFDSKDIGYYLCFVNNSRGYNHKLVYLNDEAKSMSEMKQYKINLNNHMNYNSLEGAVNEKPTEQINHKMLTPVLVIISIGSISVILIVFLYCFYKNL